MAFVELRARLQELVLRYGLYETLDRDRFYPTLEAGLAAIGRDGFTPEPGEQGTAAPSAPEDLGA